MINIHQDSNNAMYSAPHVRRWRGTIGIGREEPTPSAALSVSYFPGPARCGAQGRLSPGCAWRHGGRAFGCEWRREFEKRWRTRWTSPRLPASLGRLHLTREARGGRGAAGTRVSSHACTVAGRQRCGAGVPSLPDLPLGHVPRAVDGAWLRERGLGGVLVGRRRRVLATRGVLRHELSVGILLVPHGRVGRWD